MTTRIEFDDRELKQLTRDIGKFGVNANEALTNTMHRTLADTRKELSKDFHASVEGGVANQFIKGSVLANVGRRGRFITEKSDGSPNVKDFESTKSGRVFIGDLQEKILDDALENATVKELEIGNKDGSRGGGLFTIPRDVKQTRQVNGQKGLVLKYDKRGNVTRFRQKSLQTLREAARNPSNKTYFEVAKKQVSGRNGKQLYPGIYRRERNRRTGVGKLRRIVAYSDSFKFNSKLGQFGKSFNRTGLHLLEKNFDRHVGRQLDKAFKPVS